MQRQPGALVGSELDKGQLCALESEGQQHFGLHEEEHDPESEGSDYSLLSTCETTSRYCVWFGDPHYRKDISKLE